MIELHNPADMPDVTQDRPHRGAVDQATILVPDEYLGGI
jgi:translation elongation factor EF-4